MKKRIFLTFLIIQCFLFSFPTYAQNISFRSNEQVRKVSVVTDTLKAKNDIVEYELHIPVFSNLKNEKLQRKLNHHLKKEIKTFKKQLEKEAKNASVLAQKNGWEFRPYAATVTYKITYNQKGILSFILSYYQYTGGAHGLETWNAYNINLKNGSNIELEDCFTANTDYTSLIQQEIIKQIKENPSIYFPDAEQKILQTKDFLFYLENEGFVVYFPLYEIAPYASGIRTFLIPFHACQDMLN